MMIATIIFIIILIIACILFAIAYKNDKILYIIGIILAIISAISLGGAIEYNRKINKPSAIDVYRGNTQLEIIETIRDSVVIKRDTIIVFKDK